MSTAAQSLAKDGPFGRHDACWIFPYGLLVVTGVVLACWLRASGFPCPRGDDSIYKSPAAELVQHGRLAVPCSIGFLPQAESVFACYPPIYQLLLSAWYLMFGVSLYSSLAFTYTVHLVNVLAVAETTRRLLEPCAELSGRARKLIVLAVGLIHLGNLAYFDRQEEAALLFVWAEVLLAAGWPARRGVLPSVASGVLVGLAGLTSPWVGVLGAMIVALRFGLTAAQESRPHTFAIWGKAGLRLGVVAVIGATLAGTWYAVVEMLYPGAIRDQFFGTLGFLKDTQGSLALGDRLGVFLNTLFYNPPQLPASLMALILFPVVVAGRGWRRVAPLGLALYGAGVLGVVAVAALRPIAYTYLGAAQMVLLPCLGPAAARYFGGGRSSARIGIAALVLCAVVAWKDVALCGLSTWRLPAAERPDAVFDRLTALIPPGEAVAVTSRHWHAFQGRNPWREAYFSSLLDAREVRRCKWLVLAPGLGTPGFIDAFELVEQRPARGDPSRTYAYSLWRRRPQDSPSAR